MRINNLSQTCSFAPIHQHSDMFTLISAPTSEFCIIIISYSEFLTKVLIKLTYEPKIESLKDVLLSKAIYILFLVLVSTILTLLLAILFGNKSIQESTVDYIAILGFIEVGLGAIFSLGVSEVAYASRSGLNPVYGETITKDRIHYHTTQILTGINLIFSGIILLVLGTFLS